MTPQELPQSYEPAEYHPGIIAGEPIEVEGAYSIDDNGSFENNPADADLVEPPTEPLPTTEIAIDTNAIGAVESPKLEIPGKAVELAEGTGRSELTQQLGQSVLSGEVVHAGRFSEKPDFDLKGIEKEARHQRESQATTQAGRQLIINAVQTTVAQYPEDVVISQEPPYTHIAKTLQLEHPVADGLVIVEMTTHSREQLTVPDIGEAQLNQTLGNKVNLVLDHYREDAAIISHTYLNLNSGISLARRASREMRPGRSGPTEYHDNYRDRIIDIAGSPWKSYKQSTFETYHPEAEFINHIITTAQPRRFSASTLTKDAFYWSAHEVAPEDMTDPTVLARFEALVKQYADQPDISAFDEAQNVQLTYKAELYDPVGSTNPVPLLSAYLSGPCGPWTNLRQEAYARYEDKLMATRVQYMAHGQSLHARVARHIVAPDATVRWADKPWFRVPDATLDNLRYALRQPIAHRPLF